jgi:putative transposase
MIGIPHFPVSQNHYHLVVHVDQARARGWTMHEVVERWTLLFARPPLIERWEQDACDDAEREIAERLVDLWRRRLCDVSWYMH